MNTMQIRQRGSSAYERLAATLALVLVALLFGGYAQAGRPPNGAAATEADCVTMVVVEYWSVSEANMAAWHQAYNELFIGAAEHVKGWLGVTVMEPARRSDPGARRVLAEHPWLQQRGVRTNMMIDFDALLQHEYSIVAFHYFSDEANPATLLDEFRSGYEKVRPNWRTGHPNARTVDDALIDDFFRYVDNHWDVYYQVNRVVWKPASVRETAMADRSGKSKQSTETTSCVPH